MEEMMIRTPGNQRKHSTADQPIPSFPAWKLYENPFYISPKRQRRQESTESNRQLIHLIDLPISASNIAASFWDLTFIRSFMECEFDMARAEIAELKAELEYQRKARKKMEARNKRLVKQLSKERKEKEALERVCEEVAREISSDKEEVKRMKKEIEEEREMIRMTDVLREERVQMKLAEAKILMEEKLQELEFTSAKRLQKDNVQLPIKTSASNADVNNSSVKAKRYSVSVCSSQSSGIVDCLLMPQRTRSPSEPENPHIRLGIKGFFEFPKVLRAIGSRFGHLATKLECQKAQLRILLKQKNPIPSNNLTMS